MKNNFRNIDKPLFIVTVIFSIFGLLMVFSASSIISSFSDNVNTYSYFLKQGLYIITSYVLFFIVLMNFPISKYQKLIKYFVFFTFLALALLFVFGVEINGSKSWFNIFDFFLQPSEFAKITVILYLAFYFYKYQKNTYSTKIYYYPILIIGLFITLIILQPDSGTALIILLLMLGIYFVTPLAPKNKKWFWVLIASLAFLSTVAFIFKENILKDYQLKRFTYKEPCSRYIEDTGYHLCNSYIAINNGGLFGVGLGNSTQKFLYLPAAHTDFIFAIIIEEWGSIIGVMLIILYLFVLNRIYRIAKRADNLRNSIIAFGTFIVIGLHILINLAGITGLVPLTGVPLPLLSYGGSFTIVTYILMFLVQRVAIETNQKKIAKELSRI